MTTIENCSTADATIFVIDDDPAVRNSLRFLIESVGLPVETFGSAAEFLASHTPDRNGCIVSDVKMLGMTGLELQEHLHEQGSTLPMILITAYADVPMAVRAIKYGAIDFFEKPVDNHALLEQVQIAIADQTKRKAESQRVQKAQDRYKRLTPREAQVMEEVVAGHSSKVIGERLGVSFKTVEAHRAKIMKKMEVDNVPHLIRSYMELPPGIRQQIEKPESPPEI